MSKEMDGMKYIPVAVRVIDEKEAKRQLRVGYREPKGGFAMMKAEDGTW